MHDLKRSLYFVPCLAVALLIPAAGYAQQPGDPAEPPLRAESWTVTPAIGVSAAGDLEDAAIALGGSVGYNWTPRLSIEGEIFALPSATRDLLEDFDTTIWTFTGNVLYHFAEGPFVPYAAAGLGIGHGNADIDDAVLGQLVADDSSTELVLNLGGGVVRRINERASVRGDARYFFGDDFVADFFRLNAGVTIDLGRP